MCIAPSQAVFHSSQGVVSAEIMVINSIEREDHIHFTGFASEACENLWADCRLYRLENRIEIFIFYHTVYLRFEYQGRR